MLRPPDNAAAARRGQSGGAEQPVKFRMASGETLQLQSSHAARERAAGWAQEEITLRAIYVDVTRPRGGTVN